MEYHIYSPTSDSDDISTNQPPHQEPTRVPLPSTLTPQQKLTHQPAPVRLTPLDPQAQRHPTSRSSRVLPPTRLSHTLPKSLTRRRDTNYSRDKVMRLLFILRDVVPISKIDWENVLASHSELFHGRNVLSLRRKLQTLHRKKVPTGNSNMPEEVRLVKEIKDLIGLRSLIGDGVDDFDMEGDDSYTNEEGKRDRLRRS